MFNVFRNDIVDRLLDIQGVLIGGGAVRSFAKPEIPINDFDVFFTSLESFVAAKEICDTEMKNVFSCPEGLLNTYKKDNNSTHFIYSEPVTKIQLIRPRIYNDADDLLDSFDFTVCRFAMGKNSAGSLEIFSDDLARADLESKTLRVNRVLYPSATLKRVNKYISYGFKPHKDFYPELVKAVRESPITNDKLVYID